MSIQVGTSAVQLWAAPPDVNDTITTVKLRCVNGEVRIGGTNAVTTSTGVPLQAGNEYAVTDGPSGGLFAIAAVSGAVDVLTSTRPRPASPVHAAALTGGKTHN